MLAVPAESIRVGAVFRLLESELPFAECLDGGRNTCPLDGACRLKGLLCEALGAFYATLDRHTLADLVAGNTALAAVFETAVSADPLRMPVA